jgi:hypothetical protein
MTKITPQASFWSWFIQHEPELFGYDPDHEIERERLFGQLAAELQKVNGHLTF